MCCSFDHLHYTVWQVSLLHSTMYTCLCGMQYFMPSHTGSISYHYISLHIISNHYISCHTCITGRAGQVCIMIHSGSRGLGHQVATDALTAMEAAMMRDGLVTNDRQLACARINSQVQFIPVHLHVLHSLVLTPFFIELRCSKKHLVYLNSI